jgi:TPR repeat protein
MRPLGKFYIFRNPLIGLAAIIVMIAVGPALAAGPLSEDCPQGRQIRAQKSYPPSMSDCEVLEADTAAENRRLQRGPVPGRPYPLTPPSQSTTDITPRPAKSRTKYNPAGAPVTECDTYAANPLDPERNSDGIAFDKIKPDLAVPVCESAVQMNPNNTRLIYQLGRAYQKKGNLSSALAQYRRAADQGYAAAQASLAFLYENGQGVPKDDVQAVTWDRKAAEQGHAGAQQALGSWYENGRGGVPKDDVQAVAWYRKAADQGNDIAQFRLGLMYYNGQGVPKDDAQAVAWFRKASDKGDALAQGMLGAMYESGQGVETDLTQAAAFYRKAAEQGNDLAQTALGVMYSMGWGVPQDLAEAAKWWRKAADQGNAEAQKHLATQPAPVPNNQRPSAAENGPDLSTLLDLEAPLDVMCRSGDQGACHSRENVLSQLHDLGWCYGPPIREGRRKTWKLCSDFRSDTTTIASAPSPEGPSKGNTPIESNALIDDTMKGKFEAIDALVSLVRLNTYKCESVSVARPWLFSRGYTLLCNNYSYEYEIADKGGHWIVTVK